MVAEKKKESRIVIFHSPLIRWAGAVTGLCLFVVGACLGAYAYRVTCEARGAPLGTMLPEFKPAVLFAAGRGMVVPEDLDCPALDSFLASDTVAFDPDALPDNVVGSHIFFSSQSSFAQSHWLLFYGIGWCWRIFGISHSALQYLAAFFYGLTAVALYGLFRAGMGSVFSVFGVLLVLLLPSFLSIAPLLRDFSKAPFLLLLLALMLHMLKRRCDGVHLLYYGLLLGLLAGIGYGFRQDMLVAVPPMVLVLFFAPVRGKWRLLYRGGAVMAVIFFFCLVAVPVIIGVRSDSGSVSSHTLFQGTSRETEQRMNFGDACYDLMLHPYDTEVHATVNAHARLRGCKDSMKFYLSPAYGRAGRALFLEWACMFPADLFMRGLASIDTCTRLSSLAVDSHAYKPIAITRVGRWLAPYHKAYHRYVERYGVFILLTALFLIALKNKKQAVLMLFVLGWFMAYPNLLFEVRHAFYLSCLIPWSAFFIIERGGAFVGWFFLTVITYCFGARKRRGVEYGNLLFVFSSICVLIVCVTGTGVLLRMYQQKQVVTLLDLYRNAVLTPVPTVTQVREHRALVKPAQQLPGLRESWNLPIGDVAAEYVVLEFAATSYPVPVTIRYQPNRGPDFTRQLSVPAATKNTGVVRYYFPVYEMANYVPEAFALMKHRFSNTPIANLLVHHWGTNRFLGVELYEADLPLLKRMYRVSDKTEIPWLLYLHLQEEERCEFPYKTMRLEKGWEAFKMNFGYDLEKDADMVVSNYLELLRRFPGYDPFVSKVVSLIPSISDPITRSEAWRQLARSVPEHAERYAVQIAAIGDDLEEKQDYDTAQEMYRTAMTLSPKDKWYEVSLADCLLARNAFADAQEHYQAVLMVAPESPYSAAQLENVYNKQDKKEASFRFWRRLHEKYPDAAVPAMYLARAMEREDRLEEALKLYLQVEASHPENKEALLRRGIILAMDEGYAKGRSLMDEALNHAPELRPDFVAGLTRIAEHYTKTGAYSFAEAIYREVMELAPEDGWLQVRYGEVLLAQEHYEKAGEVFLDILARAPESPYSAHKLNEIFEKKSAPEDRIVVWESLCKLYPDAYVPALHYAMALEDIGHYEKALAQLRKVKKAHPEQQEAALRLGMLIARLETYEEGRAMMDRALKDDASLRSLHTALLTLLAEHFLENKEAERAGTLFSELVEANAEDDFLKIRVAESLILQQRYEEALELCRELILKAPENTYVADLIDSICAKDTLGFKRAQIWQSISEALPESVLPFLRYGDALEVKEGGWQKAYHVYSQTLGHAPENATLQLRYGILTALLEDYEKGRALMDEAVRKSPELAPEMASGLARLAAKASEENGYEQAESLYREAITFAPEDYAYHLHLAAFLLEQERWEDARALLRIILKANPESPLSARFLDSTYEQDGNNKKRLETWREIVEANPEAQVSQYHLGLAYEACDMQQEAFDTYKKILELNSEHTQAQTAIERLQDKPL